MPSNTNRTATTLLAVALAFTGAARAEDDKDKGKADLSKIPMKVTDALRAKFPSAQITDWGEDKDGDKVVYDIDFTVGKQRYEAEIFADGTYRDWEKEIDPAALPKAVRDAVTKKHPGAAIKAAEEVYVVKDGKDVLNGYEVDLTTSDKKEREVKTTVDGKITDDTEKKDEKGAKKDKK